MITSSPTLTTAVTSAPTCRAYARTPTRKRAPPMPPASTTMRMRPSSRNSFSGPQVGAARGLGEGRAAKFRTVRTCLLQLRSPTHPSAILTGGSVTTQPGAEPSDSASASQTSASQTTKPLRDLGALVLVGANAVFLVVALLNLLF